MNADAVHFICAGGTIDKLYHDALSDYQVGDPQAADILARAGVDCEYEVQSVLRKDSLDMDDDDRASLRRAVEDSPARHIVITHGTDTMTATAEALAGACDDKVVVLVGAMRPARFRDSDADFNLGFAVAAARCLAPGVYIAMNGRVFRPGEVAKNRTAGRFETRD